jgi:hypothetical protein
LGNRANTKRAQLAAILVERSPVVIDAEFWEELRRLLTPISESYLRQLLKQTDVALDPLVEGVNLHSLADLERTLLSLQQEYAAGDPSSRRQIRRMVIEGKDRARWSLKKASPGTETVRQEMLLWLMTWLENPEVFPTWLILRKKQPAGRAPYAS